MVYLFMWDKGTQKNDTGRAGLYQESSTVALIEQQYNKVYPIIIANRHYYPSTETTMNIT